MDPLHRILLNMPSICSLNRSTYCVLWDLKGVHTHWQQGCSTRGIIQQCGSQKYARYHIAVAGANFRGIACQPFRRNFRGFDFRVTERAPRHSTMYVRCLFKISRFLFSRWPTDPRKTRNFAPSENFPLYGMPCMENRYLNNGLHDFKTKPSGTIARFFLSNSTKHSQFNNYRDQPGQTIGYSSGMVLLSGHSY